MYSRPSSHLKHAHIVVIDIFQELFGIEGALVLARIAWWPVTNQHRAQQNVQYEGRSPPDRASHRAFLLPPCNLA